MPQIISCMETGCFFNVDQRCHAMGVTVGKHRHAKCVALRKGNFKCDGQQIVGNVDGCEMTECIYNEDSKCMAFWGIHLVAHEGHADCRSYKLAS